MPERAFQRLRKPDDRERAHFAVREPEHDPRIPDRQLRAEQLSVEAAVRSAGQGDPLAPTLRADLEDKFGRDLGHIRVHSGKATGEATAGANALAFTRGAHIYIAAPEVARHPQAIAHEVKHAVHQGAAPPLRFAERSRHARGAARAGRAPASAIAGRAPPAQKIDFDIWGAARAVTETVESGIGTAVGTVTAIGTDLLNQGRAAVMAAIREHLPEFAPMFEGDGIASFLRRLIESGFRRMFDGLMQPLRNLIDVDALSRHFHGALENAGRILGQLVRGDCSGLLEAARGVSRIFNETLSPVFTKVREGSEKVRGFFSGLLDGITAPIMQFLRNLGGSIWQDMQGFISDLGALIRRARALLGAGWERVKGWLGIRAEEGESEGGGIWNWVRDKATEVGNAISERIRPVLGPMRQAAGTLLLIVPGGQILAIILLWPQIRQGFDWISQTWEDLNLIPRSREFIANTLIPRMRSNFESFLQAVIHGVDWLLARFEELNGFITRLVDNSTGILAPMRRLMSFALDISRGLLGLARDGLRVLSTNLHSIIDKIIEFMTMVGDVLLQLIAAIVNPFGIVGILAGHIWLLLPDCLKGPIIDFLLDVVEAFIEAIPNNPLLGILWPVVRSALLGFVRRVKSVELAEKIELADKIANIISGQSIAFAFGYLRGIVLGIWEAVIAPFQALALIFELPDRIQRFLENIGVSLCEIIEQIRCFIAGLAGAAFGRLDSLLGTLQEFLSDPGRIVDMISCAIDSLLSAAEGLGRRIADGMLGIFRESDDQIGERVGRFTGSIIVQAVITYFTAGVSVGVGIGGRIAEMLGAVGRALGQVLRFITQQFGRLVRFIQAFIARIGRAIVSGARSILSRMRGFFQRVFGWFGRLAARLFNRIRRTFMMSAAQRVRWELFQVELAASLAAHHSGITRRELRVIFRRHLNQFRDVARWPSFITKHGPNWRLRSRHVKGLYPHIVGHVPLDPATRLRAATREAKRDVRQYKRLHRTMSEGDLERILGHIRTRYNMREFSARYSPAEQAFEIHGVVNPVKNWRTRSDRPDRNEVTSSRAHRAITVNPLTKLQIYSPPTSMPWSPWNDVEGIRAAPSGTSSLYVRGHIAHGRFIDGYAGNLMPISRDANGLMRTRVEGPVIMALRRRLGQRPVFTYQVTTGAPRAGTLIRRRMPRASGSGYVCRNVPAERTLVSSISITATPYTLNPATGRWNQAHGSPITTGSPIPNVGPSYVSGYGEPCV